MSCDAALARRVAADLPKVTKAYCDVDRLLEDDALTHALVTVPTDQSVSILTRLIEADKQVFTEKPTARSAAEFAPLLTALARHPVTFAVAYMGRRRPVTRQMHFLYQDGAIGRLLSAELRMITTQVRFRDPGHWLFNREIAGGGIVSWLGCHCLDMLRYVPGRRSPASRRNWRRRTARRSPWKTPPPSPSASRGGGRQLPCRLPPVSGAPGYEGTSYDRKMILRGTAGTLTYQPSGQGEDSLVLESTAPGWQTAAPQRFVFSSPAMPGYGGQNGLDSFREFLRPSADDVLAGPVDALRVLETARRDHRGRSHRADGHDRASPGVSHRRNCRQQADRPTGRYASEEA